MKHYKTILCASLIGLLAACNSDEKEIARAAQGYLDATANYQVEEAMPYANRETREVTLPFIRDKLIPITLPEYIDSNTPATIKLGEIIVIGDTAVVGYTKTTPIKKLENEILVVKEEGEWLVYMPLNVPESIPVSSSSLQATTKATTEGPIEH